MCKRAQVANEFYFIYTELVKIHRRKSYEKENYRP